MNMMKTALMLLPSVLACWSLNLQAADEIDFRNLDKPAAPQHEEASQVELPQALQDILLDAAGQASHQDADAAPLFPHDDAAAYVRSDVIPYNSTLTVEAMGHKKGITINAGQKESGVTFNVPLDKVIVSAKLGLYVTLSDKQAEKGLQLDVKLNGQPLGTLPLNSSEITNYELSIPAEFLAQENALTFESADEEFNCRVDYTGNYRVILSPESFIAFEGYDLELGTDLSIFPLPFFDNFDPKKRTINMVVPKDLSPDILKGAAMMASYFGIESSYKGIDFKVSYDSLPETHVMIFAHPGQQVAGIAMPSENGVYIKDHPYKTGYKALFVIGSDDESFINAVATLTDGNIDAGTDSLKPRPHEFAPRKPYDAPYWIPTDRKVYLDELLHPGQSLVTYGYWHDPVDLTFKAAPDLYQLYDGQGDLFLSYEFPLDRNLDEMDSGLNIALSGNFIEKYPVNKRGLLENIWRLSGGDTRDDKRHIQIDPKQIYGDNNLEIYFDLRLKPSTACSVLRDPNVKSVVDDSSYLDLSNTKHFARMPNLTYFVGSSFPFSRYADLMHTTVVLPLDPSEAELKTLMDLAARSGDDTGVMTLNEEICLGSEVFSQSPDLLADKDFLVIATLPHRELIEGILDDSPFYFNGGDLNVYDYGVFSTRGGMFKALQRLFSGDFRPENTDANRYVRTSRAWRGFMSFLSPFNNDHVAVVVTATDDTELTRLSTDLASEGISRNIGGDLTVISGDSKVVKYNVGDYVYAGNVSTVFKIITFAGEHVFWLCLTSFITLIILSFIICNLLRRRARLRLQNDGNVSDTGNPW